MNLLWNHPINFFPLRQEYSYKKGKKLGVKMNQHVQGAHLHKWENSLGWYISMKNMTFWYHWEALSMNLQNHSFISQLCKELVSSLRT